jgi:Transposase IS116/IS110/IS902 family
MRSHYNLVPRQPLDTATLFSYQAPCPGGAPPRDENGRGHLLCCQERDGRQRGRAYSGTSDAAALAQLARGRLREKIPQLEHALAGQFGPHHRFLIAQQLAHIDFLDAALERVSAEIGERLRPFDVVLERLQTIPGVGRRTAEILAAEIGTDLTRFPSARHLASWAGLCPGNDESAGKRRSGRTRQGSPWLRAAVGEDPRKGAPAEDRLAEEALLRAAVGEDPRKGAPAGLTDALREITQAVVDKFNPPCTCDPCPWCYADQDYEPHASDCIITELRKLTGTTSGKEGGAQ